MPRKVLLPTGKSLYLHDHQEFISDIICSTKDYFEKYTLNYIRAKFDLSYVLDIGANIGNHSHFFANECNSTCYAFEPSKKNFQLCSLNLSNQHLYNIALSDTQGVGKLYTYKSSMGNNTLADLWDEPPNWGDGLIEEKILISQLDAFRFPAITFMKIDVEGSEMRVLRGAYETIKIHKPGICIEYGGDEGLAKAGIEYRSNDIRTFLEDLDYITIGNDGGGNNFYLPSGPVVFF